MKLLCDAHLKYLIKILITQNFITRSGPNMYAGSRYKVYPYNLTICNFSPDGFDDQGLAVPERFQLAVEPECDYDRLIATWSSTERKLVRKHNIC